MIQHKPLIACAPRVMNGPREEDELETMLVRKRKKNSSMTASDRGRGFHAAICLPRTSFLVLK